MNGISSIIDISLNKFALSLLLMLFVLSSQKLETI